METVGPLRDARSEDDELHLLTEWGDPASRGRTSVAERYLIAVDKSTRKQIDPIDYDRRV